MTVHYRPTRPRQQQQNALNLLDSLIDNAKIIVKEVDGNGLVTALDIISATSSALPAVFGSLFPELNTLRLDNCRNLMNVSSIGGMRKLRKLCLWRCPVLRTFPEELCERLKELELEHCKAFDYNSSNIRNMEGLEEFRFQDDGIDQVPLAIWSFSNLKRLHVLGRRLTAIPKDIGNLTRLEELRFDGRKITSLSRGIGALVHLKNIRFYSKDITELPDEMGELAALESVDFAFCENLKRIPAPVLQLPNLAHLDMMFCYDLTIPENGILECTDSLIEVKGFYGQQDYSNDFKRSLVLLQHMVWLNKNGRYLLKKKRVPLALWGAALVHWSSNVDSLFFFLKQKPDVIPEGSGKRRLSDL